MKTGKRPNVFLCAAMVLLCLVLISSHFTSGLYARFTTKASGSDQARTAAFNVTAELAEGAEANTYQISFHNHGETAVRYSVEISIADVSEAALLPSVELNGVRKHFSGGKVLYENLGSLAPGENSADATLRLNLNAQYMGDTTPAPDFSNETADPDDYTAPFTVRVLYAQND